MAEIQKNHPSLVGQTDLEILHTLANFADEIALKYFNSTIDIRLKSDQTPVTNADTEIETTIRNWMAVHAPSISIYGEEFGGMPLHPHKTLIIDPIDGTSNFMRNIPIFATLLAFWDGTNITSGMVSAPALACRWWASQHHGAFCNTKPIRVSQLTDISKSQCFYGSLFGIEKPDTTPDIGPLLAQTHRQRGVGDFYSHMLVAQGSGEFALDFGLKLWDMAPLGIIVSEAGGIATHLDGHWNFNSSSCITSNGKFHDRILSACAGSSQ